MPASENLNILLGRDFYMKNVYLLGFSMAFSLVITASGWAQGKPTLDEQITQRLYKEFPEWKPENQANPFGLRSPGIRSRPIIDAGWKSGQKRLTIILKLEKSPADAGENFRSFFMRSVMPYNRKITGLGDEAYLVETADRVEIAFTKANIFAVLNLYFPAKKTKTPFYYLRAPKEEVENLLTFARAVAGTISGPGTAVPCFNDFYRPALTVASETPEEKLLAAIFQGNVEAVKIFVLQGVNLKYADPNGDTAMHFAARQGCSETIKILSESGAEINIKNEKGKTPLMIAANAGDPETVSLLLSLGADVQAKDIYGRNAAFYALYSADVVSFEKDMPTTERPISILKTLKSAGLNFNEKDTLNEDTLLTHLMHNLPGKKELAAAVLDLGVDVNEANKYGETALIKALKRGSFSERNEIIEILLGRGANVNHKDQNGLSAMDYAKEEKKRYAADAPVLKHIAETIRLLKNAGATE